MALGIDEIWTGKGRSERYEIDIVSVSDNVGDESEDVYVARRSR